MSKRLDPVNPPAKLYLRTTHAIRRSLQQMALNRTAQEKRTVKVTDILREAVEGFVAAASARAARKKPAR